MKSSKLDADKKTVNGNKWEKNGMRVMKERKDEGGFWSLFSVWCFFSLLLSPNVGIICSTSQPPLLLRLLCSDRNMEGKMRNERPRKKKELFLLFVFFFLNWNFRWVQKYIKFLTSTKQHWNYCIDYVIKRFISKFVKTQSSSTSSACSCNPVHTVRTFFGVSNRLLKLW